MSSPATAMHAFLLLSFLYLLYSLIWYQKQRKANRKRPPGPVALPVIGHLHMLGTLPHRTLQSLAQKYGPIMSLQLGQVPAIVVSTSEAAELFLKDHDVVFASRPKIQAIEIIYGSKGMAFSDYGPYWRTMKKACTLQLFSASSVGLFAPLRKQELDLVVKSLQKAASLGQVVNISDIAENLIEDIVYKMILGCNKDGQSDFKRLVRESLRLVGAFNPADFVPWLAVFDLQGFARDCKKISKASDEALEKIIKEHEQAANTEKGRREDFIDILLSMMNQPLDPQSEQSHVIDRANIKATVFDMITGSIETTATVIGWALSELLRHPRVMKILQDVLEDEVGMGRMVQEGDLENEKLSYLDMVVYETLRLYPVGPLLLPRESREDITINGYFIQKKSRIIVNAWAIGRDPNVWSENAEAFCPERFVNKKINFRGQDFEFIPFGSGRRGCPGINLGLTTAKLVIAQLVHCFNWKLPCNVSPANLSMQETFGLSMPRAQQLQAIPTKRLAGYDAI